MSSGDSMGIEPAIGAAMWHLQRGYSLSETLTAMQRQENLRGMPDALLKQAINYANRNVRATAKLGNDANQQIGQGFSGYENVIPIIGVRVLITVIDSVGNEREISVTVNAPGDTPQGYILAQAVAFVESGQLAAYTGRGTPSTVAPDSQGNPRAYIVQLIEGGLENPNLQI